jgi:uncharacterized protein YegP (UPF0339 family)
MAAEPTTPKPPKAPKPNIIAEVYQQQTMLRSKEKFGVRVIAPNRQILFSSEKYHNHLDALHAANLLATGKITVVDTT